MAYQTTTPTDIDYMYKLPENEMLQAINTSDSNIDNANNQADLFDKYIGSIKALPSNQNRLSDISDKYRSQISDVTNDLNSNPANYRQSLPNIRNLSRSIQNDKDLQTIQNQYQQYQQWQSDNKDADPTLLNAYKQKISSQGAYNPETNSYAPLNLPEVSKTIDWAKKNEEWMKDMKPISKDGSNITIADMVNGKGVQNDNGDYLVKTKNGTEYVSKDRIKGSWENNYNADSESQRSVQQYNEALPNKQTINTNNNISFDKNNNAVTPKYTNIGAGDYMANQAKQAAIGTYAYSKTKTERDISENGVASRYFKANQDIEAAGVKYKHDLEKEQHDDEKAKQKEIADAVGDAHSDDPDTKAQGEAKLKYYGVDKNGVVNAFKEAQTNNPASTTTELTDSTGNKVTPVAKEPITLGQNGKISLNYFNGSNKLDANVVAGNIQSTQHNIETLNKVMSKQDTSSDEWRKNNEDLINQQNRLDNQQNLSSSIRNNALDKYNQELKKQGLNNNTNLSYDSMSKLAVQDLHQNDSTIKFANKQEYDNAQKAAKIYKDAIKSSYDEANKNANQNLTTIGVNSDKGKILIQRAFDNGNIPKLIDGETGTNLDKSDTYVNGFKDYFANKSNINRPMSLDSKIEGSLGDIFNKDGDNPSNHIKVKSIVHADGIGTHLVVNIDNNKKDFLMSIPQDVASDYARNNMDTTKPESKEVRSNIINEEKGTAKDNYMPALSYAAQLAKQGIKPPSHEIVISKIDSTGKKIVSKVTLEPHFSNETDSTGNLKLSYLKGKYKDKDGNLQDYKDNTYPTAQSFFDKVYDSSKSK